jgi:hypothetical protein
LEKNQANQETTRFFVIFFFSQRLPDTSVFDVHASAAGFVSAFSFSAKLGTFRPQSTPPWSRGRVTVVFAFLFTFKGNKIIGFTFTLHEPLRVILW